MVYHYRKVKIVPNTQAYAKYKLTFLYPKIMKNKYLILEVEQGLACFKRKQESAIK